MRSYLEPQNPQNPRGFRKGGCVEFVFLKFNILKPKVMDVFHVKKMLLILIRQSPHSEVLEYILISLGIRHDSLWKANMLNPKSWRFGSDDFPLQLDDFPFLNWKIF